MRLYARDERDQGAVNADVLGRAAARRVIRDAASGDLVAQHPGARFALAADPPVQLVEGEPVRRLPLPRSGGRRAGPFPFPVRVGLPAATGKVAGLLKLRLVPVLVDG
jgi:hypothetical protein